jgi:hypothetical protein
MDQYNKPLYIMCINIVKRTDAAEDIVIEAFEKLWFMRTSVEYDKAKAFLFSTAKNAAFDVYRRQLKYDDVVAACCMLHAIDPVNKIDCRDAVNVSFKIISGMQKRHNNVKSLRIFTGLYVFGVPPKELGIPTTISNVKGYFINRIRRQLSKEII